MSCRLLIVIENGDQIWSDSISGISMPRDEIAADFAEALKAPDSVISMDSADTVTLVPVRVIQYVRIEEQGDDD